MDNALKASETLNNQNSNVANSSRANRRTVIRMQGNIKFNLIKLLKSSYLTCLFSIFLNSHCHDLLSNLLDSIPHTEDNFCHNQMDLSAQTMDKFLDLLFAFNLRYYLYHLRPYLRSPFMFKDLLCL